MFLKRPLPEAGGLVDSEESTSSKPDDEMAALIRSEDSPQEVEEAAISFVGALRIPVCFNSLSKSCKTRLNAAAVFMCMDVYNL